MPLVKFSSTNQKYYPDLSSDASSVWNFWARFSDVVSRGNRWWRGEMSGAFSLPRRRKSNRPFPSSPGPLFQNEGRWSAFDMEIIFHFHANKTRFHKQGCAPSLILKVFGTRKWPIKPQSVYNGLRAFKPYAFGSIQFFNFLMCWLVSDVLSLIPNPLVLIFFCSS